MITIIIETDNAAFEDGPELSRILRKLADDADTYGWSPIDCIGEQLCDVNGNTVGRVHGDCGLGIDGLPK